jgi:hypothetical protein
MNRTWLLVGSMAWAMWACGDDERPSTLPYDPDADVLPDVDLGDGSPRDGSIALDGARADADAASDAASDAGSDANVNSPEGPTLEVLSPAAATNPATDTVLTSSSVTVRCRVSTNPATNSAVDPNSVKVVWVGSGATPAQDLTANASSTSTIGEYQGVLPLTNASTGPIRLGCRASDISTPARTSTAEITTLIDRGPNVTISSPANNSYVANAVNAIFCVTPSLVAATDPGAAIDSVTLKVGDVTVSNIGAPNANGCYNVTMPFDDPSFAKRLDGPVAVQVIATNSRTPQAVEKSVQHVFNADNEGPKLTLRKPTVGQLVGGLITLEVELEDPAGIAAGTAIAVIANNTSSPVALVQSTTNAKLYSATFDTRTLPLNMVQPSIQIFARDTVNNSANLGFGVFLDNRAPLVSLDPLTVVEYNNDLECSTIFDPLGNDAVNKGQRLYPANVGDPVGGEFRARIEDIANGSAGTSTVVPISGVNNAKVQLFLLDSSELATNPLLVDTNSDGTCDEVNPLVNLSYAPIARRINLAPASPRGSAWYAPIDWTLESAPFTAPGSGCGSGSAANAPNNTACVSTDLFRVIKSSTILNSVPAIYGIPDVTNGALSANNCVGTFYDFSNQFSEGWGCAVVRVEDNLGNIGVSKPLMFCLDTDGANDCGPEPAASTCTGVFNGASIVPASTCTPPADFDDHNRWRFVPRDS